MALNERIEPAATIGSRDHRPGEGKKLSGYQTNTGWRMNFENLRVHTLYQTSCHRVFFMTSSFEITFILCLQSSSSLGIDASIIYLFLPGGLPVLQLRKPGPNSDESCEKLQLQIHLGESF